MLALMVLLLACAQPAVLTAQTEKPEAKVIAPSDTALLGDQVKVQVEFFQPMNIKASWPIPQQQLNGLEVISESPIDTLKQGDRLLLKQQLLVTAFDSGDFKFPALTWAYYHKNDTTGYQVQSNPAFLHFKRLAVDTTGNIKAIKEPLKVPLTFLDILPWLLIVLVVLIVAYIIYRYFFKNRGKPQQPRMKIEPPRPAHLMALEKLKLLEEQRLWQSGEEKLYYIALSNIIRNYLERRYHIFALENTTPDLLRDVKQLHLRKPAYEKLELLLERSDLVKFAKFHPLPEENQRSLELAYEFVDETKLIKEAEIEEL